MKLNSIRWLAAKASSAQKKGPTTAMKRMAGPGCQRSVGACTVAATINSDFSGSGKRSGLKSTGVLPMAPIEVKPDAVRAEYAWQAHQALLLAEHANPELKCNPVWRCLRMDAYEAFSKAMQL